MNKIAVRVESLSKRYRIGQREPYRALRDVLARCVASAFRRIREGEGRSGEHPVTKHIWALDGVSFDVKEGEVIGIIGRNGAGKSTLLKILSRITKPSSGFAETYGRLASLLEVGTGFHLELTGRENIYLNGAILGMKRTEIARKLDDIVAFAQLEKFTETPVKYYSSGMYVRLAFAVAAHLEPEILLVDEVLAVGDLEFQKKCLGKMRDVSQSGRTVLLVSHQMNQIRRLCSRCVWLDNGRVRLAGATNEVVAAYEGDALNASSQPLSKAGCFQGWSIAGQGYVLKEPHEPFELRFALNLQEPVSLGHFGVVITNDANLVIAGWAFDRLELPAGPVDVSVAPRALPIRPGTYSIVAALFDGGNNLTGGRLVEIWQASPPLIVDSVPIAHPQDEWSGLLNIAADMSVSPGRETPSE